ncbi:sensor histidine kinase [Roseateles sp.]|uniref:sensor histidine kinase n=1 Tax=Roseateles sp. TaxID=1971397 RepID=UPI0025D41822|nr:histidine kinase [Roseateles sp.]
MPERLREGWLRHRRSLALLAFSAFYLSTQMLLQSLLFEFWTPADIAQAWLDYLLELTLLALLLYGAYLGVDATCTRAGRWTRLAWMALALYLVSWAFMLANALWRSRLAAVPDLSLCAALAGRLAIVPIYIVGVQTLWQRAREMEARESDSRQSADALERESRRMRLQLLKAQIEPHFLFNTLANMRQLYRTDPDQAAPVMRSLQRYLRAALPRVRRDDATLADELDLVRAYLMLVAMRMPARLAYRVHDGSGCAALVFPAMVVLTLVENAIRHGIEPSAAGGRVDVTASTAQGWLSIRVRDDGVGFGAAQIGGSGVGLANVRRQLQASFGTRARLLLAECAPGVEATLVVPMEGA